MFRGPCVLVRCDHAPAIIHRSGGKDARLDNVCGKCGEHIVRKTAGDNWRIDGQGEPTE